VKEVPGNWEWAMERPRSPCEVRKNPRQVGRAQGEVRKPKCQRKEDQPGAQRLKTCERLCTYLHETTNIKHAESRPRLANTWKCRGY
jgi:hypothetical protein